MNIGFVGLGAMGALIVQRLMDAGHSVTGWNRSPEKTDELVHAGMGRADSPRKAAERAEIVFSIVTDATGVRAVALGEQGILSGLRQGGGTGLGMPIARSLTEAHGGRMWLESELGKGATFYVALPIKSDSLVPTLA